ncbi:ATP-binding protein [Nocardiopsis ganjiahuensis]|uniref:ATP-binding protein n=1 Tax=Nocardiopsis ganjiahuensis TaxID=239984 RepID=UPI00038291DB|nr:ATP-binding protein [Nocardiopsis ganjiahuensis]
MSFTRPSLDLPRRIRCTDPDQGSLECGHQLWHLKVARSWATHVARTTPASTDPLLVSLSELHTNALTHTASGLPGGRVRIEIERRRRLFLLRVTDDGPRTGQQASVPEARLVPGQRGADALLAEGGYGLALVDAMSLYWDFTRDPGGGLTVRAAFDRSGRTRMTA